MVNDKLKKASDLFDFVLNKVDRTKISKKQKSQIKSEIQGLKSFVVDQRPARIAIVGRRGAGKSSLINAIFGELRAEIGDYKSQTGAGKWYAYENERGAIDILDTRGLGESDRPDEKTFEKNALDEVKRAIASQCPDVILFLCKAKEVGARLDEDIAQVKELRTEISKVHAYDAPVIGVVTQVDELAPVSVSEPPYKDKKKRENIDATVDMLEAKLQKELTTPVTVIPISAYMEFDDGELVYDRRWQVDVLLDFLIMGLPIEAQVILAKLSRIKKVQKKLSRNVGRSVMTVTGIVGATPVPIADMPVITGLQMSMIGTIAMIGGHQMDRKTIAKFLSAMGVNVGVGMAFRTAARQLVKLFPGAGSVISGTIASAGTFALCEASIAYFIDRKTEDDAKEIFNKEFKKQKEQK